MTAPSGRPIEADEFERASWSDGYELVDGSLVEQGWGALSSEIKGGIMMLLHDWKRAGRPGYVFDSTCSYRCFSGQTRHVRKPDVSFVHAGRLPRERLPKYSMTIPPDFVAEVVSPNEAAPNLDRKVADLLGAGVPLLWVVHPNAEVVDVYRPGTAVRRFSGDDELCGDLVLPGLSVRVADLFPPPPPADAGPDEG